MRKSLLHKVGIAAVSIGMILTFCLLVNHAWLPTTLESIGWVASSALAVFGGVLLYVWSTSSEHNDLKDTHELFGGRVLCRSTGLTSHKCVIHGISVGLSSSYLVRTAARYFSANAGYKLRELTSTYAILTRGSLISRRKSAVLLIYVDKEDTVVLEYKVAPLQASGLYDLKVLVDEVRSFLTECEEIREALTGRRETKE